MSIDINQIVDFGVSTLVNNKDITEEDIDVLTYKKFPIILPMMFDGLILTDDDLKIINNKLKKRIAHTIEITNSVLISHDHEAWFKKRKNSIKLRYWDRYKKYLINEKKFNNNIVEKIDDVVDELTDLVGDPTVKAAYQRRGLIIGDVQSGKTSNFIGLMCKACDAGYKLIVVLAGTSNELRKQTQSRVDEGLIGVDSDNRLLKKDVSQRIGAAKFADEDFSPVCVTSLSEDFNKQIASSMGLKLNQTKDAIIFVVKKNVTVLDNLNSWIKGLNQTDKDGVIDSSLLVVDDEADYASINTNKEDKDPTKTNEKIEELLQLFKRTSYVGFTATPYANVFINPETREDMNTEPLFPKDYIYCLDAPSNYIGARNLFGEDINDKLSNTIKIINSKNNNPNEINNILPLKHKKEAAFDVVPISLKKAILEFFIVNTIRDLRGDKNSHRSMLINISRFVMVHEKIKKTVKTYVDSLCKSIIYCGKLSDEYNDINMQNLKNIYESEYKYVCENNAYLNKECLRKITWSEIKTNLNDSTSSIVVRIVNEKSKDSFDYEKNKENGLRVIAIGGIALSRGLTLEGLMISYFYRNSQCYDTLMQMGRWFGYRDGYVDLCRIWMTDEMNENYYAINRATEELRESIIQYKDSGLTPLEFGIKVRTDPNLLITSRNKMRSAKEELVECSLSSSIVETSYLSSNKDLLKSNYELTVELYNKLSELYSFQEPNVTAAKGFYDVDVNIIMDYLQNMKMPIANIEFENGALSKFIEDNKMKLLKWDVAFVNGRGRIFDCNERIRLVNRKIDIKPETKLIRVSGRNRRVGTPGDGWFGLTVDQKNCISNKYGNKKASQRAYFSIESRNPLLSIYMMEVSIKDIEQISSKNMDILNDIIDFNKEIPIVAVGIGIPNLGNRVKLVKYAINKIEQGLKERNVDLDYEDIDDEE